MATYPIAGVLGSILGLGTVSVILAVVSAVAVVVAGRLWRNPTAIERRPSRVRTPVGSA